MGGGLEQAGAVGNGVEESGGGHPARLPGVLGHHAGERLALFRGGAGERVVEHARVGPGEVLANQQRIDIRERPAVDRRARYKVGGEAGGDGAHNRQQSGERPPVALRSDAGRALGAEPAEADRAAHVVRHAAALTVIVEGRPTIAAGLAYPDIRVVAGLGGALVGRAAAGLGDQGTRNGGAPEALARAGHDWSAFGQRLLREGFPDRVGEVAAEMGEAHDGVLGAVHAARQRRHQGDRRDDAHDRPGAEPETPLAGGVDDAGGGVPDQQEAGEAPARPR